MKTRLIKNWITSVAGLILLALGGLLVYKSIITWEAYVASWTTCFLLFRAKDSLLWKTPKE